MKTALHKIFTLVMLLVFLASTSGIILASHTCLADSHASISFFANRGCCADNEKSCGLPGSGETAISSKCCITEYSFHKIDGTAIVVKAGKIFTGFNNTFLPQSAILLRAPAPKDFSTPPDPPPGTSGKKLLLSLHRLLV